MRVCDIVSPTFRGDNSMKTTSRGPPYRLRDKFTYNKLSGVPYCCGNIFLLISTKSVTPPGLAVGAPRMSYTLRFLYLGRVHVKNWIS